MNACDRKCLRERQGSPRALITSRAPYTHSSRDENKVRQSYLYEDVKKVLNGYHGKRGSLKSLSLKSDIRRKGATLSLSSKTLLYGEAVIDGLLSSMNIVSPLPDNQTESSNIKSAVVSDETWYRRIVATDLLFGSGKLSRSGHDPVLHQVMKFLRRNQSQIHEKFQEYLKLHGSTSLECVTWS
eukprot:759044-Hanusia_phi.AAC.3